MRSCRTARASAARAGPDRCRPPARGGRQRPLRPRRRGRRHEADGWRARLQRRQSQLRAPPALRPRAPLQPGGRRQGALEPPRRVRAHRRDGLHLDGLGSALHEHLASARRPALPRPARARAVALPRVRARGLRLPRQGHARKDGFGGLFPGGDTLAGYDESGKRQALAAVHISGTLGAGIEWFIRPRFALALGARYHYFPANELDNVGMSGLPAPWGPNYVDANTGLAELNLGFTWFFGSVDRGRRRPDRRATTAAPTSRRGHATASRTTTAAPIPTTTATASPTSRPLPEQRRGHATASRTPTAAPIRTTTATASPTARTSARRARGQGRLQDADGCPDPDNDGDGIPDLQRRLPRHAGRRAGGRARVPRDSPRRRSSPSRRRRRWRRDQGNAGAQGRAVPERHARAGAGIARRPRRGGALAAGLSRR